MKLSNRNELARHLGQQLETGYGAEVGVQAGWFSRELKKHWGGFLLLIDAWRHWPVAYEKDDANVAHDQHLSHMTAVARLFIDRPDVIMVRAASVVASGMFPEGHFDWVYIDANHGYEAVKKDIAAWLPKVRSGGILAGHDYGAPADRGFGVQRAVDEIFGAANVNTTGDSYCSWWIKKT